MELFSRLQNSILEHSDRNAFFIENTFYSYNDFAKEISKIRLAIRTRLALNETNVGIVANDDLETYAAIIALWFEGKSYVPLSPEMPYDRNIDIMGQASLKTVIDSSDHSQYLNFNVISSNTLPEIEKDLTIKNTSDDELAYILFTSGTTGKPKGVPITRANLSGFIEAFWDIGFIINQSDRCLQMFELTFDLSVMSYLVPLLKGACVYTIPKNKIKFAYIYDLFEEHKLTVALMVPSILQHLRKYFDEILLPEMRYSLFCGEALGLEITNEWAQRIPNAEIFNVYGPTEDTIFCTFCKYQRESENKSSNGILSIGKSMQGNIAIVIDEHKNLLKADQAGELCLGGVQLTPGYWNNESKNNESFFLMDWNGKNDRFYRTGDVCKYDNDMNILYLGRIDSQIKVQGFRVELSEIEFNVKNFINGVNAVAVSYQDSENTEIGLVLETASFDVHPLLAYLRTKIPAYMIPKKTKFIEQFPLNINGKTDRKKLASLFKTVS